VYETQPVYDERPTYAERPTYTDEPVYEQQAVYSDRPVYGTQPVYEDRPVYSERPVYGERPVYNDVSTPVYDTNYGVDVSNYTDYPQDNCPPQMHRPHLPRHRHPVSTSQDAGNTAQAGSCDNTTSDQDTGNIPLYGQLGNDANLPVYGDPETIGNDAGNTATAGSCNNTQPGVVPYGLDDSLGSIFGQPNFGQPQDIQPFSQLGFGGGQMDMSRMMIQMMTLLQSLMQMMFSGGSRF
jgi:hypothetical protein